MLEQTEIFYASDNSSSDLISFFSNYPVTSNLLSYRIDRSPDYFAFSQTQGYAFKILLAIYQEKIVGTLSVIFDQVYLEGKIRNVAYTGDLRITEQARGTGIADLLMQEGIKTINDQSGKDTPIFTCVFKDNLAGLKKNQNLSRNDVARMETVGEIRAYFIVPFNFRKIKANGINIRIAEEKDVIDMIELWNTNAKRKSLSRVMSEQNFYLWLKNSGLKVSDYLLAFNHNKLVGFMGLWNQNSIRRFIVTSQSNTLKNISRTWNWFGSWGKLPRFPQPGETLPFYNVVNHCISDLEGNVFPLLLEKALENVRKNDCLFLCLALDKKDPLNKFLKPFMNSGSDILLLSNYQFTKLQSEIFHMEVSLG